MAQFTKYSSTDASAPVLNGTAGSLITVLDAVLVNGYGAKAAAGWSQPIATASDIACYKQGVASKAACTLLVNDDGSGTPPATAARITGWRTLTTLTGVGVGSGQFPLPSQLQATGFCSVRKSASADAISRPWVVYADDRTFYFFMGSEAGGVRRDFGFGEFYSYWGASDTNNCFIQGRVAEGTSTQSAPNGGFDKMNKPSQSSGNSGAYFLDTYAGVSGSTLMSPCGDDSKAPGFIIAASGIAAVGSIPAPNPSDNSYYLAYFNLLEPSWAIRGRYRGLVHICHSLASIGDGSTFTGTGEFSGRTYDVVNTAGAGGMVGVETSDTLDTN